MFEPTLQELGNALRRIHCLAIPVANGPWEEVAELYARLQQEAPTLAHRYKTGSEVFDTYQEEFWRVCQRWCNLYLSCGRGVHQDEKRGAVLAGARALGHLAETGSSFLQSMDWAH